jgi:beta-galactosidase
MSSGYESGGFGLINLDGTITERSKEAGAVARVVDRNQSLFLNAQPPKAQVAVVYNPLAHFVGGRQRATPYGGPQSEVAGIERDSLLGIHRALYWRNVPLDYVHIDHMTAADLRQYKLVFMPYPLMIPEKSAAVLREYVNTGGTLVAEARLCWNNERGQAADRIPGLGLSEVMGCRESAVQTGAKGRTTIRWTGSDLPGLAAGSMLPGRWYEETLEPMGKHARAVAEFEGGGAAAVASTFGRGKTLMLGSYVSAAYQTSPTPEAEWFFEGLLKWAGVEFPVEVTGAQAEVRTLESGTDTLVFVFNHGKQPATAAVTLKRAGATVYDLLAEKPLQSIAGPLTIKVPLRAQDVRVFRISLP